MGRHSHESPKSNTPSRIRSLIRHGREAGQRRQRAEAIPLIASLAMTAVALVGPTAQHSDAESVHREDGVVVIKTVPDPAEKIPTHTATTKEAKRSPADKLAVIANTAPSVSDYATSAERSTIIGNAVTNAARKFATNRHKIGEDTFTPDSVLQDGWGTITINNPNASISFIVRQGENGAIDWKAGVKQLSIDAVESNYPVMFDAPEGGFTTWSVDVSDKKAMDDPAFKNREWMTHQSVDGWQGPQTDRDTSTVTAALEADVNALGLLDDFERATLGGEQQQPSGD